jgi:hypothetical protein
MMTWGTSVVLRMSGYALWQAGTPAGATALLQFDRTLLLEDAAALSANVSMGDLNGDGNLDIVLARGQHTPLVNRVLINDGRGRFPVGQDLGTADRSFYAGLVDIDVDGDLDIVVGNDRPDPKPVYLNDGKGNFRLGSTYGRPEWPMRNASVADLNGDGLPDIIAANRTGGNHGFNYFCLNLGKGEFDADCIAFSRDSATTITPADVNRDGFIDLVVPHREGGQSYVYLNDGKAVFSKRVPFGPPDAAIRVAEAADLDGEGFVDIVAIGSQGPSIYLNQQGRAFAAGFSPGSNSAQPNALAVGDLNVDRKIDIVVGNTSARPEVYFNDGSGRNFTPVQFGDAAGVAFGIAIGDLDKDGHRDIAVARAGAPSVVYFGAPALQRAATASSQVASQRGPAPAAGQPEATTPAGQGQRGAGAQTGQRGGNRGGANAQPFAVLQSTLGIVDLDGVVRRLPVPPADYRSPRVSPDGRQLAVETIAENGQSIIWVYDLSGKTAIRRLTQEGNNTHPIWTRDGKRVAYGSDREKAYGIYWQLADGSGLPERLTTAEEGIQHFPESWSPDGRVLSFGAIRLPLGSRSWSLWTISMDSAEKRPTLFYDVPSLNEFGSAFSPDGEWIAYATNEAPFGIYVQPYPPTGVKYEISRTGGAWPVWSPSGGELFYRLNTANVPKIKAVTITTKPVLGFTNDKDLPIQGFLPVTNYREYDIMVGGKEFIMVFPLAQTADPGGARP